MLGAVGLLAVALGWIVVRFDGFEAEIGPAILLIAAGVGSVALIMTGPIACLAAIAALTVAGIQPQLAEIGGVEATLVDVFYLGLVGWWLRAVIGRAQQPDPAPRPRIAFGQRIAIVLFAYVCLTFFHVAGSNPDGLSDSIVSWLRLAATLSIAFLAASVIETKRDVRIVLGAIALAGVGAVIFAAVNADGLLGDRAGGALGPNALGLVVRLAARDRRVRRGDDQGAYRDRARGRRRHRAAAGEVGRVVRRRRPGAWRSARASPDGRARPSGSTRPIVALAVAGVCGLQNRSALSPGGDTRVGGLP